MTRPAKHAIVILVASALASCGREATPTGPSGQTSFLTGTWRGTVTIQVNASDPNPPPPMTGDMTWAFEVVPQTNMQSLRATIRPPAERPAAGRGPDVLTISSVRMAGFYPRPSPRPPPFRAEATLPGCREAFPPGRVML